ncbi:AEC family transporter [Paenibacillus lignilyticus]|uniref:AEC family transporter n=1 Tax=Paenibacillus lignilyticus TaxID=1172615 RepID=A0ABS5C8H7_9BACL|nr:AEC family transporter [Paenibacillus lignilyticus]MBP3962297.1 AEC family transporter [Paenibacillus lignilyticus]
MVIFLSILWNNIIPLSVMIAIGITLHRVFSLDIKTLSKLNFYLFSPAIIFKLLYTTEVTLKSAMTVLLFFVVFMVLMYACVEAVIRLRGIAGGRRGAMRNSVLFYNSANYGIPLNELVFASNPYTLSIQVLIMMLQALLPNTYGIYSVNAHRISGKEIIRTILKQPVIYAIPLGFLMRGFHIPIPYALSVPLDYSANAFIGTALVTLGVQLGSMKFSVHSFMVKEVLISCTMRLLLGPLLAFAVVWMLGLEGLMAQALIVSSSVPTSLSSVLLAVEFDNEQEFASQAVLASTVLSIVTVTLVIFVLNV